MQTVVVVVRGGVVLQKVAEQVEHQAVGEKQKHKCCLVVLLVFLTLTECHWVQIIAKPVKCFLVYLQILCAYCLLTYFRKKYIFFKNHIKKSFNIAETYSQHLCPF